MGPLPSSSGLTHLLLSIPTLNTTLLLLVLYRDNRNTMPVPINFHKLGDRRSQVKLPVASSFYQIQQFLLTCSTHTNSSLQLPPLFSNPQPTATHQSRSHKSVALRTVLHTLSPLSALLHSGCMMLLQRNWLATSMQPAALLP